MSRADHEVVVGLDAGGTRTRARAMLGDRLIHDGIGGPGNPMAADDATLAASYASALASCPRPARLAACVAGTTSHANHARVLALLAARFPDAVIQVVPDYVAALLAAPEGTDALVIAGTGSLVCSRNADGAYATSGGRGWILGDHGSAARLGRAALEWFCDDPAAAPHVFAAGLRAALGSDDWRSIVARLSSTPNPSALLGRAAPLLTEAAAAGAEWAVTRLEAQMLALATTTDRHIEQNLSGNESVQLALSGGVWSSDMAQSAFVTAMRNHGPPQMIIARSQLDPIEGAVRLAASMHP